MQTILSHHTNTALVISDAIRVDETKFIHTTQIVASNFTGLVRIEATIETTPAAEDWFDILMWECLEPTSETKGFTTKGKYAHVRATLDRMKYAANPDDLLGPRFGVIDRILFK